jgi:hypothetical protein
MSPTNQPPEIDPRLFMQPDALSVARRGDKYAPGTSPGPETFDMPAGNVLQNLAAILDKALTISPDMLGADFGEPSNTWNPWITLPMAFAIGMLEPGPDVGPAFKALKRIPRFAKGNKLSDALYDVVPDKPPAHWSPEDQKRYMEVIGGRRMEESPFALQALAKTPDELDRLIKEADVPELGWWANRLKEPWGVFSREDPSVGGFVQDFMRMNSPSIAMDHDVVHLSLLRELGERAKTDDVARLELARFFNFRGAHATEGTAAANLALKDMSDENLDILIKWANEEIGTSRVLSQTISASDMSSLFKYKGRR